jgi:hypothetical protein
VLNGRSFAIYIYNIKRRGDSNLRHGKLSADEVLRAEKARDDRIRSRNKGFAKMHERDEGMALLNNGVLMLWPVVEPEASDKGVHVYPRRVPEGKFVLKIGEETRLFDAEEFRSFLRWV